MESHYGFKLQELQSHPEIEKIQERKNSVVHLRYIVDNDNGQIFLIEL